MVATETETAREKALRRWHVHPETASPHSAHDCDALGCTIADAQNPEKYLLSQGTIWRVGVYEGEDFTGKLRSISKGVLRFETKDGEVFDVKASEIELKPSTAKIA